MSAPKHRSFVGPSGDYDINGAMQFNLLTAHGLREHHTLLDIGCGSLRGGRLFINYLLPNNYFGIEPNYWLIKEAMKKEIGVDILNLKRPTFNQNNEFKLTTFNRQFDFIIAQSIFSHAAPNQIKFCLNQAYQCMHPKSKFFVTFFIGKEDHKGEKWVYPGCTRYRLETMASFVEGAKLSLKRLKWKHPRNQTWLLFTKES